MNIFMTGGTGFLGHQMIEHLLSEGHHVYALARSKEKAEQTLKKLHNRYHSKINFVYGDITKKYLGLNVSDYNILHNKIDTFYHIAALVKFDEELREELFTINYEGTKNTLELSYMVRAKHFIYVSTAYTLGQKENGEEKLYDKSVPVNNPYEESKRLAEHLVFSYKDMMNVSIFRPSIIVGDSKTGEADSMFTLYGFIRGLEVFKKRVMRKESLKNKVFSIIAHAQGTSNFVPVDYVSKVLTVALEHSEHQKIYHITNPNAPTNQKILNYILQSLNFPQVAIVDSNSVSKLTKEETTLNQLIESFNAYLTRSISFSDSNTQHLLQKVNESTLHMDDKMLENIIYGYKN